VTRVLFFGDASSIHLQRWVGFFANRVVNGGSDASQFDVMVASWHRPSAGLDASVRVLNPMSPFTWFRLLRWGPDIVHVHYLSTYGFVAFLFVLLHRVPFIGTVWGSDIRLPRGLWRRALGFILRRMDVITCDAQFVARELIGLGVSPRRIRLIFFGTDVENFRPVAREPNVNPGVISCRGLSEMYDVACAGQGPLYRKLVNMSHGSGAMFVFPGWVDMASWLPHFDVFVNTSPVDAGLSASTAEAMACGLPVVVTDTCENSWWVDEHCGLLFPASDPVALADALIGLLKDPSRRRRMGKIGRRVIVRRNSFFEMMSRVSDLYVRCVMPDA